MESAFHLRLEHDDLTWTLVCGGELDVATAPRLEQALDLCEQLKPRSLHIDGRDLTFIDSAGISALIRCAHRCNEDGIAFALSVGEQVRQTLAHVGIAERLLLGRDATTPV